MRPQHNSALLYKCLELQNQRYSVEATVGPSGKQGFPLSVLSENGEQKEALPPPPKKHAMS